jgi:exodeoxyribonuclease VII large subunit
MAQVLTVSQLTRTIRELVEGRLGQIWVEGEISNHRKQSSGHHYFTLKDDRSQLTCVMFARSFGAKSGIPLSDGLHVQVYGQVTVYEARGQYQLVVQLIQTKGQGLLQARFEALKRKLEGEGLFSPQRKRRLPGFPLRIALITSPTGAVLQDMLNILQRRSPWLSILICPVRVQGEGAAEEIAEMIDSVNRGVAGIPIDLLIVGRGGGSLEDLWAFNEEIVARSIFRSRIPIVSAVGHEIDFTIADFVADFRAPTPSAAAEMVAPDVVSLAGDLRGRIDILSRLIKQSLEVRRLRLERLAGSSYLRDPRRILTDRQQQIDQLEARLLGYWKATLEQRKVRLGNMVTILSAFRPDRLFEMKRKELDSLEGRLKQLMADRMIDRRKQVAESTKTLRILGPQQTLERGYSITMNNQGDVVRSIQSITPGETLRTRLVDGEISSTIDERMKDE